ncbi:hypothetical protein OIU83_16105 [Flavobacterium sp. LS1R49]|uniref:Uncharacterized protein n=1 Tax=Flavobacterium shii TaxID=2987687 RepID=A0A9X2ZH06_9FLAO|nr:hypothetical protein [Flavobacterium shii]MCV9929190.1 hypothetical protein [Flavobacterium shii]
MLKTETAFVIFFVLAIIVFPYYIFYSNSDFLSSLLSGLIAVDFARVVAALIKFIVLSVVTFFYWKLSRITAEINFKKFTIQLLLTIPGVLISKINLYPYLDFSTLYPDFFISRIQIVVSINIFTNTLFFLGQVLFGIFYIKLRKTIIVATNNSKNS